MNSDLEQLRLLSIFHFVAAAMIALVSLLPIFHLVIGIVFLVSASNPSPEVPAADVIAQRAIGSLFTFIAGMAILIGLTTASCVLVAGKCLARHCRYMFCLVTAGLLCLFFPIGTVLGVFTILVLNRSTVRVLFGVDRPEDKVSEAASP
ncbi:MAG: hypothetical protein DWQ31_01340 [Planctomycetota bacterium]|nr:MAG: hypothetical protein DWQ31_01340 [Planctomycetota bacterium]REJ95905.1 MAG: hypothetical protein DWQ35_05535 [Planctomycetota bacterium]REK25293.1 MAG: hypothetical protein DWQ42_11880 [Planctomycetota bacterium]REK37977.1 MAG: hypothetical protein DWQ46_21215 [Planctomycetota bacterium]